MINWPPGVKIISLDDMDRLGIHKRRAASTGTAKKLLIKHSVEEVKSYEKFLATVVAIATAIAALATRWRIRYRVGPLLWMVARRCVHHSCDAVTSIFMLHELPPKVRRTVMGEAARVLKSGGRLILMDSLGLGTSLIMMGCLSGFRSSIMSHITKAIYARISQPSRAAAGLRIGTTPRPMYPK